MPRPSIRRDAEDADATDADSDSDDDDDEDAEIEAPEGATAESDEDEDEDGEGDERKRRRVKTARAARTRATARTRPRPRRSTSRWRPWRPNLRPRSSRPSRRSDATYKKFHKLQVQRVEAVQSGEALTTAQEKRYQKLRQELVDLMEEVRLNNARIEQLVEQLYELNKLLMHLEGRLLRLAVGCRIKREEFLEQHYGHELAPDWIERISKLPGRGWKKFVEKHQRRYPGPARQHRRNLA